MKGERLTFFVQEEMSLSIVNLKHKIQERALVQRDRIPSNLSRIGFSCEDTKSRNKHFSTSKATQRTLILAPYPDATNLTEFP